ncbi:hypothetical protein ACKYVA_21975, partial [Paenibacillus larvae]|uniref:hypothetical protein n=1 Tax=Paenibacillus larvae TaxID=1464 RepID=UPI0039082BA5
MVKMKKGKCQFMVPSNKDSQGEGCSGLLVAFPGTRELSKGADFSSWGLNPDPSSLGSPGGGRSREGG